MRGIGETCGDDRFELIAKAKAELLDATNIESSPMDMTALDSILFRCWQMGWLDNLRMGERETINKTGDIVTHDSRAAGGTLTAEQVRKAIFNGSSYASYDGAQYYANGIDMQAIADELNSRAERTCRDTGENEWHFVCSACGYEQNGYECWNYCPNCGAKVVGE